MRGRDTQLDARNKAVDHLKKMMGDSFIEDTNPKWYLIETAPRDGTEIIIIYKDRSYTGLPKFASWTKCSKGIRKGMEFWTVRGNSTQVHATHWMPRMDGPDLSERS